MVTQILNPVILKPSEAPNPWRFMLVGGIGAGKTTLLRVLEGKDPTLARKSQMIDYAGWGIDTPGEFSERALYRQALVSSSFDTQLILVVQDATNDKEVFPPNYFLMFPQRVIGVITKVDDPRADTERSSRMLIAAGVTGEIFYVSAFTGYRISALREYILSQNI